MCYQLDLKTQNFGIWAYLDSQLVGNFKKNVQVFLNLRKFLRPASVFV